MLTPAFRIRMPAAACLAAVLLAAPAAAQEPAPRWMVRNDPAADLWFHGLALAGAHGFGALPLTDPAYAARVRAAKRDVPASRLDERLERFRAAFAADSAFEVLQFVPVWMPLVDHRSVAEAMRRVAEQGPAGVAGLPPRQRLAAAAVAGTLTTASQRRLLADFADALESEWAVFLAGWRGRGSADAGAAAAEARWNRIAAAVAPYLRSQRLTGGLLLVSPALGPDGRLFEGLPDEDGDAVIAVQLPADGSDAAYLALRETCFPFVRRLASSAASPDRVADERLRGTAAVQCGAMLLDRYAPGEADGYRAFWSGVAGQPFERAFVIPEPFRAAMVRELTTP